MFNPIDYMRQLHGKLKLTKTKYKFVTVSSISSLEGVLQNSRRNHYFFAVVDAQDGLTFRGAAAGYFERRPHTVFILGKADYNDSVKRQEVLVEAKEIYRKILSKMIRDKMEIPVLNMEQIRFYEVPPAFATGCSGLYFTFNIEDPVNLIYNAADWDN